MCKSIWLSQRSLRKPSGLVICLHPFESPHQSRASRPNTFNTPHHALKRDPVPPTLKPILGILTSSNDRSTLTFSLVAAAAPPAGGPHSWSRRAPQAPPCPRVSRRCRWCGRASSGAVRPSGSRCVVGVVQCCFRPRTRDCRCASEGPWGSRRTAGLRGTADAHTARYEAKGTDETNTQTPISRALSGHIAQRVHEVRA